MKKLVFCLAALIATFTSVSAQEYGIANHLGLGVGVGSEGINVSAATCLTKYVEAEFGVNFMPGFNYNDKLNVHCIGEHGGEYTTSMDIKAGLSRTTFDFKASVYPFGERNAFFVVAGLSFGGSKIVSVSGSTSTLAQGSTNPYVMVGDYKVNLKSLGNNVYGVDADAQVNGARPYIGVGYGRLIPKHRLGFRVELGCQFHGTAEIYENGNKVETKNVSEGDKDVQDFIDKMTVYPVLKFSLRGRIL